MSSYYHINKQINKIHLNGVSKEVYEQRFGKLYDTKEEAEKNFNSDPRLQKCIELFNKIEKGSHDYLDGKMWDDIEKVRKEIGE